jgi:hypothetical protein
VEKWLERGLRRPPRSEDRIAILERNLADLAAQVAELRSAG